MVCTNTEGQATEAYYVERPEKFKLMHRQPKLNLCDVWNDYDG